MCRVRLTAFDALVEFEPGFFQGSLVYRWDSVAAFVQANKGRWNPHIITFVDPQQMDTWLSHLRIEWACIRKKKNMYKKVRKRDICG